MNEVDRHMLLIPFAGQSETFRGRGAGETPAPRQHQTLICGPHGYKWFAIPFAAASVFVSVAAAMGLAHTDDGAGLIAAMDEGRFQPPRDKGRLEIVDGKVGKATRFQFAKDSSSTFFTSNIHGTPEWDRAGGLSFWVKGRGEDGFGGLEFIYDDDYAVRYDLAFPVKGTGWSRVNVAWADLIPVLPGPKEKPLGTPGGNPPSKLSGLWFGRWWYWGDYPALTFDIDEIRLEPKIAREASDLRPEGPPLARVRAKLRDGKPITIVTMGDSLTDRRHWANRETCWVDLLSDRLREKYRSPVTIVNPAIGGTQLRQNLVLIPKWLDRAPEPDLVTIFFGGNDWDSGMRGEEFRRACADAVDRIRRATKGKADVLFLTTNPTATRWEETGELAEACRTAARDRNAGLADTENAFHVAGKTDRDRLFVHDRVHLSRPGHAVVAETVQKAIED
jgi:lysophospholipase L1-like esterase